MAVLTLLELDNVSSTFGTNGTEYAMFSAQTVDNDVVRCGITHNLLTRLGFDLDNLDSLVGCKVQTKVFTDNRTGELVNPEDQIQKVLDGESTLVLFNSINATIVKSDLFKIEQKEMVASTNAKAKVEMIKEKKARDMQAAFDRLRARALAAQQAAITTDDKEESLDDDADAEPATTPVVKTPIETELEF